MQKSSRELWLSMLAIVVITLMYSFVVIKSGGVPAASNFFGHSIGIIGFILMLMTEILYTLRKRSQSARWGKMQSWLQFHIFTGLVGPYMVLLHTSWKFNGLAGVVMLLTIIIVVSGFIGRYIYTAVPRTIDGIELETNVLEQQIRSLDEELERWLVGQPALYKSLSTSLINKNAASDSRLLFGRAHEEWNARLKWWKIISSMDKKARHQAKQLNELLNRERNLRHQLSSIARTRKLLGLWHAIHIPLGMALFTAAFVHIVAAIYYATLLK